MINSVGWYTNVKKIGRFGFLDYTTRLVTRNISETKEIIKTGNRKICKVLFAFCHHEKFLKETFKKCLKRFLNYFFLTILRKTYCD